MSLAQLMQSMQMASQQPGIGSRIMQGQDEARAMEDRQLQREQILRQAEMSEDMFDVELQTKRAQLEALLAGPGAEDVSYDIKQDREGNWVYIPKQPGTAPLATGVEGPGVPEVEAKRVEQEAKEFEIYRERAEINSAVIQEATRAVNAIKDAIEEGTQAGGPAAWWRDKAAQFLMEFNVDPDMTISLTNINPKLKAQIDSSLNKMAMGELQHFKGPTTDFEYSKAAEVVGTTASVQEVVLQVLKNRMEATVQWQSKFQELNREHGRDFGSIARGMRTYGLEQPMRPWQEASDREALPPAGREHITPQDLFEQSRESLKWAGKNARVLYDDLMSVVQRRPDLQRGIVRIPVPKEGKYIILKDGVVVGSQPMTTVGN